MSKICNKDYSISCVRFIAMCFIIICHMMQRDDFSSNIYGAHIGWAFWFNVGVQMFLFLSGYLYGKKDDIDTIFFFKKNFSKLLVDYYVFVIIMLIIIHFSTLLNIDKATIIALITLTGTPPGLGHLWFIPTILFCYLLTPILHSIITVIDKHSTKKRFIESLLFLLLVHEITIRFLSYFNPTLLNCYILGMIYSRIERRSKTDISLFYLIIIGLCIFMIPIQFKIDYWSHNILTGYFAANYSYFCGYGHVFLGITIIFFIRAIYNKVSILTISHPILDWSDKYSYDVYLTHHIFIQSAFGCVEFIDNRFIALPLAVLLTIIASLALYYISNFIRTHC